MRDAVATGFRGIKCWTVVIIEYRRVIAAVGVHWCAKNIFFGG